MFQSAILILAASQLLFADGAKFPSFIKKCSLSDPKLKDCVLNQADSVRDAVLNGIPDLKVPKLNPFHINELVANSGDKVKLKIENVDVYGMEGLKIKDFKFDLSTTPIKLSSEVFVPTAALDGDYDVDAKVLVLEVQGHGKFNLSLTDFTLFMDAEVDRVMDKAKAEHFQIKSLKLDFDFENVKFYLENLFNGNKELGDQTLKFINENAKSMSKDFRPAIMKVVKTFILQIVENLLRTFTIQEAFLP